MVFALAVDLGALVAPVVDLVALAPVVSVLVVSGLVGDLAVFVPVVALVVSVLAVDLGAFVLVEVLGVFAPVVELVVFAPVEDLAVSVLAEVLVAFDLAVVLGAFALAVVLVAFDLAVGLVVLVLAVGLGAFVLAVDLVVLALVEQLVVLALVVRLLVKLVALLLVVSAAAVVEEPCQWRPPAALRQAPWLHPARSSHSLELFSLLLLQPPCFGRQGSLLEGLGSPLWAEEPPRRSRRSPPRRGLALGNPPLRGSLRSTDRPPGCRRTHCTTHPPPRTRTRRSPRAVSGSLGPSPALPSLSLTFSKFRLK